MTKDPVNHHDIVVSRGQGHDIRVFLSADGSPSAGSPWNHARPNFSPDTITFVRLKPGVTGEWARVCHIVPYQDEFSSAKFEAYCGLTLARSSVDVVDFERDTGAPCMKCYKVAQSAFNAALDAVTDDDGLKDAVGEAPQKSPTTEYLRELATKIPIVADKIDACTISPNRLINFALIMRWSAKLIEDIALADMQETELYQDVPTEPPSGPRRWKPGLPDLDWR